MKMFGYKPDLSFQLLLLVICAIAGLSQGWRGLLDERKIRHGVPIEDKYPRNRTTRAAFQNIRIAVFYDKSIKLLGKKVHERIEKDLVPAAVKYVEKLLQVKRANGPILVRRDCGAYESSAKADAEMSFCRGPCRPTTLCGDSVVPKEHLMQCHSCVPTDGDRLTCGRSGPADGGGVNADFILYVSTRSFDCEAGVLAYASHCQTEKSLDRPVAGHLNICPEYANDHWRSRAFVLSTIKHELLHALGFSANLFPFFRNKHGKPLTPRNEFNLPKFDYYSNMYEWSNNTVRTVTRTDWWFANGLLRKTVNMMVTPNVLREVRKHFKCQSLEGAELENQADHLSHWEKRIFDNEGMTESYAKQSAISRITLAALEDSGWYKVNYAMADPLLYGKGLGCDFVKNSCGAWINSRLSKKQSIAPFCNREQQRGCTASTNEPGLCNLRKQAIIPFQYQNYKSLPGVATNKSLSYGGDELYDYCAIYEVPKPSDKDAISKLSSFKCK